MRRTLMVCLCAALAACGGGGDDNNNGGGGGGGGGNSTVNVTGTNTFTARNAIGYSTGTSPITCTDNSTGTPITVSTAFLAAFVTDVTADTCALVNANQEKKGAGGVGIFIARAKNPLVGGVPVAIGPGTYSITSSSSIPAPDQNNDITFAGAFASKNAAGTCGANDIEAESGTITITSVSGGVISGSINATIKAADGGGTITGSFTTTSCALTAAQQNLCSGNVVDDSPSACVD